MDLSFNGIVVREAPNGEKGKLLYILTETLGVVTVVAKGARNISASYLKSAQLFAYSTFTVYEKNGFRTLTEAALIEGFYGIRKDILALAFASYACESCSVTAVPEDSLNLRLLLNTLFAASNSLAPIPVIKAVFEFKLCCTLGFLPELNNCADCANQPVGFDYSTFCVVCASHYNKASCVPMSAPLLKALRFIRDVDFSRMLAFTTDTETYRSLFEFCEKYFLLSTDIHPKTLDFLKSI